MPNSPSTRPPPAPPPDATTLHEAALTYLARYAATEASLRRMLERHIDRWARLAQTAETDRDAIATQSADAKQAAAAVVARLAAAGAVSDAAFAEARARSLARAGRSQRAIAAHLAAKGVGAETPRPPNDPDAELAAALVLARRRRIGPFRTDDASDATPDPANRRRELAIFARAGFPHSVAARALDTEASEALALVAQFRR